MPHTSGPLPHLVVTANVWQILGRLFGRAFDFVLLIILSRLLLPGEFGVAALAMSTIYITEAVTALPLIAAMVSSKELTREMYDTAFTLSLLRGLILGLLLVIAAFAMSAVYADTRLLPLIMVLSLAPILRGLGSPIMVNYLRDLDFRQQTIIEVAGKAFALLVASGIAVLTQSYWAIIAASITTPSVMFVLSYILAPYEPRLSLSQWPYFRSFVGWNTVAQVFSALNWQMDRLILGRLISDSSLGHFAMATDLTGIVSQAVVVPMAGPLISAFARRNEQSPGGLASVYLKSSGAVFTVAAPLFLGLSLLAPQVVLVVLGPSWEETSSILQILALTALVSLPVAHLGSLAISMNRMEMFARRTFAEFLVAIPALVVGGIYFGIEGILVARAMSSLAVLIVGMQTVRKLLALSYGEQLWAFHRGALALGVLSIAVISLRPTISTGGIIFIAAEYALVSVVGGIAYIATLLLLWLLEGRPGGLEHYAWGRGVGIVERRRRR